MKKLLLNFLIFILVAAGTSVCVVFIRTDKFSIPTNSGTNILPGGTDQANTQKPTQPEETDKNSEIMFGMLGALLKLENYSTDISIDSSNSKTLINGKLKLINHKPANSIEEFDLSKLNLSLSLSGRVENIPFNAHIILIDDNIYLTVNNIKITTSSDNLVGIIGLVLTSTGVSIDEMLNIDELTPYLESMEAVEIENGYKFLITLPVVNEIEITMNKEYIPTSINIENIGIKNNTFSIKIDNTSVEKLDISTPNKTDFIDLNNSYHLVELFIDAAKSLPIRLDGTISLFGKSADVSISVSSDFVITFNMQYNNIDIYAYSKGNTVYVYVMGIKVLTTWPEILNFINENVKIEIPDNLMIEKINENGIIFSQESSILIKEKNNKIVQIVADFNNIVIDLTRTTYINVSTQPNTNGSLSINDLKSAYDKFYPIFNNLSEFSFDLKASYANTKLDAMGYIELSTGFSPQNLFLNGKLNNKNLNAYMTSSNLFLGYEDSKISIEKSHLNDYSAIIKGLLKADLFTVGNIIEILSTEIKSLTLTKDQILVVNFVNEATLSISKSNAGFDINLSNFKIQGKILSAKITLYSYSKQHKDLRSNLVESEYVVIGNASSLIENTINTFKQQAHFEGFVSINLLGINIKNINISLDSFYENKKLSFTLTLDNLPTTSFITNINALKYLNQKATVTYKDGQINILRIARHRFTNDQTVFVNKTIKLADFSIKDFSLILGLKSSLANKVEETARATNPSSILSLNTLSILDNQLTMSLSTSSIMKALSDADLKIECSDDYLSKIKLSMKAAKIISINLELTRK